MNSESGDIEAEGRYGKPYECEGCGCFTVTALKIVMKRRKEKFLTEAGKDDDVMKLLFINACARERGISRTLELCDTFIEAFCEKHPETVVEELNLFRSVIKCYGIGEAERRDELVGRGRFSDEMFDAAHDFAAADVILVGAPCWDMSFPAVLKAYIENICVNRITFQYTSKGSEGLAAFSNMVYLTTCGGYLKDNSFGAAYMEGIAHFLGKGKYVSCCAEGLDILGNDAEAIMTCAKCDIRGIVDGLVC